MNAAARLLTKGTLSRNWVISVVLTRIQYTPILLLTAVVISALSIVYVTNVTRNINATIQQLKVEQNRIHIQWGQLLLEKGTQITPARVQHIAEEQLGMGLPDNKSVVIVNE